MEIFEPSVFDLNSLVSKGEKFTILAGAGISRNPPSNVPSAREIVYDIIKFMCGEQISNQIFSEKIPLNLRYEAVVQEFKNVYDPKFILIDYFQLAKNPNLIHYILAELIRKGHFVLTTNFDNLIEYAMGLGDPNARAVISREDFEKSSDPEINFNSGLHVLYKIHGSKENIFTKQNTKDSIIATLDALGKDKGDDIFDVQGFKRELFMKIGINRNLLVIGYSGGDDFDVIPILRKMDKLKRIIWIEHDESDSRKILQVRSNISEAEGQRLYSKAMPIDRELLALGKFLQIPIIKIKANTLVLFKDLTLKFEIPKESGIVTPLKSPLEWLRDNFKDPPIILGKIFAATFYYQNYRIEKVKPLIGDAFHIAQENSNNPLIGTMLRNLGQIELNTGFPLKGLELVDKALQIHQQFNQKIEVGNDHFLLSGIYQAIQKFDQALDCQKKALEIFMEAHLDIPYLNSFHQMGKIFLILGKTTDALKTFEQCLVEARRFGNLVLIGTLLFDIGNIYFVIGDSKKALNNYIESHKIHEKLHNFSSMTDDLNAIAGLFIRDGNIDQALFYLQQALSMTNRANNIYGTISVMGQIGHAFQMKGDKVSALNYYKKAYQLCSHLENQEQIGNTLGQMGMLHMNIGEFAEANNIFLKAYENHKKMDNKIGMGNDLLQIGGIHLQLSKLSNAENCFKEALTMFQAANNDIGIANALYSLGNLKNAENKLDDAFKYYQESFQKIKTTNSPELMVKLFEASGNLYFRVKNLPESLKYLEEAAKLHLKAGHMAGYVNAGTLSALILADLGKKQESLQRLNEMLTVANQKKLGELIPKVTQAIEKVTQK